MMNEASAVISAFSGKTSPDDEFYHLRMVYGLSCGIVAALTVGPIFLTLFSIQLALSTLIAAASMVIHGAILTINYGLELIDAVTEPFPKNFSF